MVLDPSTVQATPPPEVAATPTQPQPAQTPAPTPAPAPASPQNGQPAATPAQPAPVVPSYAGGPSYTTSPEGAVVQAPDTMRKGPVGILGRMLLAGLQGAQDGGAAVRENGESGSSAGFRAAGQAREKAIATAKAQASENQKQMNEQDLYKLKHNEMVQDAARIAMAMNHEAKMYPFEEQEQEAKTENEKGLAEINQMQLKESREKYTQWAIENDVPLGDAITDIKKVTPQLPQIVGTKTDPPSLTPVPNDGVGKDNGIHLVPTQAFQAPMKTPFIVRTWSGAKDQKTGEFIPTEHIVSPTDVNPVTGKPFTLADINNIQNKSDVQLINLQHQEIDWNNHVQEGKDKTADAESKRKLESAQAGNQKGEEAEHYAKAREADANALAANPTALAHAAQQLVDGNEDPSQLSKRSKSYQATLDAADDYSMKTYGKHFDIAQASNDYKFATNTQTQNTLKYLNSVVPNMNDLVKQSDAIKRTQLPALNDVAAWARLNAGDPKMAAYNATITEVSDQIAKILQGGGTGSGTSDAKLKQAQELFNKGFTPEQVKAVVGELGNLLNTRKDALIGDNRYLRKQYGVGGQQQNPQTGQNPPPSIDVTKIPGARVN